MRTLHLLVATAWVATNGGAQTPLTVDTNFRFYYTPELLDHWESTLSGGTWRPSVSDVVLRHDGTILVTGVSLDRPEQIPWGGGGALTIDPLDGSVQQFMPSCGGRMIEIPITDQYFSSNKRRNYDCSHDFSFGSLSLYQNMTDRWHVFQDRSLWKTGYFRITEEDPLRYVLVKVDEWGDLDPSFAPRSATGNNLGGKDIYALGNGQYLFNGNWAAYEGRPSGPVIRINSDGAQDTTFLFSALIANVAAIHEQTDGKVILAGQFMLQEYFPDTLNLLRVNVDGSLDHGFNNLNHVTVRNGPNSTARFAGINVLEPLGDGRFVIGGKFTHIEEERRGCIACVDTAGNLLDCWANGGLLPTFHTPSGYPIVFLGGFERLANGETYLYGKYQGFLDSNGLHPEQCLISKMYMPDVGVSDQPGIASDVAIGPNPGTDVLSIHLQGTVGGTFTLLDISGRAVAEGIVRPGITQVDTSTLPRTIYLLRVLTGNGSRTTLKWIKQ